MKLGTWNCPKDVSNHWPALEALGIDVIAIQECTEEIKNRARAEGWGCVWGPGTWHKGIAVLARPGVSIRPEQTEAIFDVSAIVNEAFRFVCFWAMTPKDVASGYTEQAAQLIAALPNDGLPTVVAGDFNAESSQEHLDNVAGLASLGMHSSYHRLHAAAMVDAATHADYAPTYFHLWQKDRPFHTDFIFVPDEWRLSGVEIGTFDDFVKAGLSDHLPVVATVEIA